MHQQPVLKFSNLEQLGMVVRNIDETIQKMWETFGIGPWEVCIYEPHELHDVEYHGKPSHSGLKFALAQVGAMQIELIEPIGTDNAYQEFINQHGDGVQHLGFYRAKTPEEFLEAKKKMEDGGFPCIFTGRSYRSLFAYFDTLSVMNTVLELVWFNLDIPRRVAYTYPKNDLLKKRP